MEYIFLIIACSFFAVQFIFQKLFEKRAAEGISACLWNQFVSCAVMIVFLIAKSGIPTELNMNAVVYALGYSVCGVICTVASITAMSFGKVSLVSMFTLSGGMIIPFVYGIVVLGEENGFFKWLGMIVLCISLIPSLIKKEGKNTGSHLKLALYCIVIFISNGVICVFSKAHQVSAYAITEDGFVLLTAFMRCAASIVLILIFALISRFKGEREVLSHAFWQIGKEKMTWKLFVFLIFSAGAYAVCNTLGNVFSLKCMVTMDASIQFPLLSAIVIILSAIFGRIFFGEKISKNTVLSLILSVAGIGIFMIQ